MNKEFVNLLTWLEITTGEWIPNISLVANTDGNMIPDPAVGIDATQAGTGILALAVDTRLVGWTIGIDDAFRSAVGRRSNHFRQAGAIASVPNSSGRIGVGSTGIGITWVYIFHYWLSS